MIMKRLIALLFVPTISYAGIMVQYGDNATLGSLTTSSVTLNSGGAIQFGDGSVQTTAGGGGGGSPGGSANQYQYNSGSSSFAADKNLVLSTSKGVEISTTQ